jgi:hypothetical protein
VKAAKYRCSLKNPLKRCAEKSVGDQEFYRPA